MDRARKKSIHLNITSLLETHCKSCEFRIVNKSHLICRNCPIGQQMMSLSASLEYKPIVEPKPDNLEYKRGIWSEEEEFYVIHHAALYDVEHLSRRLNRSYQDVYRKLNRLRKNKVIAYFKTQRTEKKHGLSS